MQNWNIGKNYHRQISQRQKVHRRFCQKLNHIQLVSIPVFIYIICSLL